MSLSQFKLVLVRIRVEGECFWVNQQRKIGVWFQHGRSWIQDGRIHNCRIYDGHHHQVEWEGLSQIELVWVRIRAEGECFWVILREKYKVSEFHEAETESKMAEFKKAKFKMATIIKLSQNEWVKCFCSNGGEGGVSEGFFVQMVGTNLGKYECVWEEKLRWLIPRWPNSRWQNSTRLPYSSWVRMNEFESDWISLNQSQSKGRVFLSESERRKQGVWIPQCRSWIQDGRIQDGHYHQVKWEWMSMSQNELVRVRVRVEVECFWVNLRQDNKMSESNIAVSESEMAEFKMAAITKLSENEWVWVSLN